MSHPLFSLGASILANNNSKNTGQVIGRGLMGGAQMYGRMQPLQEKALQRQAQAKLMEQMGGGERMGLLAQAYPNAAADIIKNQIMPPQPDLPTGMRIGQNGQWEYDPNYLAGQRQLRAAGATRVDLRKQMLPTDQEIRREDILTRAGDARKFNAGILKQGFESKKSMADLERAMNLLDTVETGPFSEKLMEGKRIAGKLGIDVDWNNISNAEELRVLLGNQVMARVAETKGAVSEREMDLFRDYSANFGNTPEGNKQILKFKKAQANRDATLARMVRKMQKEDKTSLQIRDAVETYIDHHDISDVLTTPAAQPTGQPTWSIREIK
jgi:hypothetical protein